MIVVADDQIDGIGRDSGDLLAERVGTKY
jgi:hypothetical protein